MSDPIVRGASKAASAAAEPPPEPPGMRVGSHGLRVTPYAECSVVEPIANSSMFVLPSTTRPAACSSRTTVASYGGTQPCSIRDPAVVGRPFVVSTSLTPMGTPASGPRSAPAARSASICRARARAPSWSTCRKAWTPESLGPDVGPSTASMRSRWARVTSSAETTLLRRPSARRVASHWTSSLTLTPPPPGSSGRGSDRPRPRERPRAPPPRSGPAGRRPVG